MIVLIWEVKIIKRAACYARAETFTEAVALMVATPLAKARASLAQGYKAMDL